MEIKINPTQAKALAKLIDKFNIEIPVTDTSEAQEPIAMMSSKEIEQLGNKGGSPVIVVDDAVIKQIPAIIDTFKASANWYTKFNKVIVDIIGDNEGALFLGIMAAFSANTQLGPNLTLATRAFHAINTDIQNNPTLLAKYIQYIDNLSNKERAALKVSMKNLDKTNPDHEFSNSRCHNFIVTHSTLSIHIFMVNKIIMYYMENGNKLNTKTLAKYIASGLKSSGDIDKKSAVTSGYKILNFALNLLDPDMTVGDFGWQPVTIDSWMMYFFYPEVTKTKLAEKDAFKRTIFGKYKQYVYLGKIIQEQSERFGLKPHELQAIIWTATIKKYRPGASSTDINSIVKKMLAMFQAEHQELSRIVTFTTSLKSKIAS